MSDPTAPTWERVTQAKNPYNASPADVFYTDRLAVPGGWIYRTYCWYYHRGTESSVFVPYVPPRAKDL